MAPTPQSRSQELINVKLLLIGNSSVGKSSLLLRFSDKQWLPEDEASATIGVDFRVRLARNLPSYLSFFSLQYCIDVSTGCVCVCCGDSTMSGTQAGGSGTEGQDEYMGASLCFSSSRPKKTDAKMHSFAPFFGTTVGHCRPRTFPHYHGIVLSWSAGRHTRYEHPPRYVFFPSVAHRDLWTPSLVHAHTLLPHVCVCVMHQCTTCRIENRSRRSRGG